MALVYIPTGSPCSLFRGTNWKLGLISFHVVQCVQGGSKTIFLFICQQGSPFFWTPKNVANRHWRRKNALVLPTPARNNLYANESLILKTEQFWIHINLSTIKVLPLHHCFSVQQDCCSASVGMSHPALLWLTIGTLGTTSRENYDNITRTAGQITALPRTRDSLGKWDRQRWKYLLFIYCSVSQWETFYTYSIYNYVVPVTRKKLNVATEQKFYLIK